MPSALATLLQHLRQLAAAPATDSDAELLQRFARHGDEDAFTALVARHGQRVLHTCRRILGDAHAAEDAFQATFLVLARRAGSLQRPERLTGWLYGVASRVAQDARRAHQRLPEMDQAAAARDPRPEPLAELTARELLIILHEELQRLPESYRLAVLLCCLEGQSQEEVARQLGWTAGQVKGRLERGRKRLHERLARRGLGLSAALAAAEAARSTAAPLVPLLATSTARAATLFTGRAAGALCAGRAVTMAEGVLTLMWLEKLKTLALIAIAACVIGGGALVLKAAVGSGSGSAGGGGPQLAERGNGSRGKGPADPPAAPRKADKRPPAPKEVQPERPPPGFGAQPPLTRERLIGSTLSYHRTPPDEIVWELSRDRFILRVKGTPPPTDLFDPLLGKGQSAGRIEGAWRLSGDNRYLELSDIIGDGRKGEKSVRLPIRPTGAVRVTIGERQYNILRKEAKAAEKEINNSIGMRLVLIPAGKFTMGSPEDEHLREPEEKQHMVEITAPFSMGVYEVTQGQYEKVMGKNPSFFSKTGPGKDKVNGLDTSDFPVESVSWENAVEYCKKLSALPEEKKAGRVYRLPTEAEWEYACRAGTTTYYHYGNVFVGNILTPRAANVNGKGWLGRTCKVGSYKPNAWGLFDMHGNAGEWCADWYDADYYKASPRQDPEGPDQGELGRRVTRGGTWHAFGSRCRSACRLFGQGGPGGGSHTIGLRVVCSVAFRAP